MDVTIREATPNDVAAIAAIYREGAALAADLEPGMFLVPDEADVRASLGRGIGDDSVSILVAESPVGGECLGYAIVVVDFPQMRTGTFRPVRYGFVDDIVVSEPARGHGVGTALLRAAEALARNHGAEAMALDTQPGNTRALRFYRERMGYRDVLVRLVHRFD